MKTYQDFGIYDFSDYAEEVTGDELFKINGGAEVENSHEGVAGAKPGDTITRNNGEVIVLKQADIDYEQQQLGTYGNSGNSGNTTPGSQGSPIGQTGEEEKEKNKSQTTSTKIESELIKESDLDEKTKAKVYGQVDPKDIKGKFVYLSVSKEKGVMDVYVSDTEDMQHVIKIAQFDVVTNVQSDCIDNKLPSDTDRYQGNGTNPTQVPNGTYKITDARVPSEKAGNKGQFGIGRLGLVIDVSQELEITAKGKNVEETQPDGTIAKKWDKDYYINNGLFGTLTKDSGYMIHITPLSYTNGCTGIKYNGVVSLADAYKKSVTLVQLFDNSNNNMYISYKD